MNVKSILAALVIVLAVSQVVQIIGYRRDVAANRTHYVNTSGAPAVEDPPLSCDLLPFLCGSMPDPSIINN